MRHILGLTGAVCNSRSGPVRGYVLCFEPLTGGTGSRERPEPPHRKHDLLRGAAPPRRILKRGMCQTGCETSSPQWHGRPIRERPIPPTHRAGRGLEASPAAAAAADFKGGLSPWVCEGWPLGAAAAKFGFVGEGSSSFLRRAFSSLSRMSLFSFKKTRAFSRPCPMRSPPKLNHVPLFSTNPLSTPRSIKSPSREMPSPYTMSNSASRKGAATLFFTTLPRVREPTTRSPSLM